MFPPSENNRSSLLVVTPILLSIWSFCFLRLLFLDRLMLDFHFPPLHLSLTFPPLLMHITHVQFVYLLLFSYSNCVSRLFNSNRNLSFFHPCKSDHSFISYSWRSIAQYFGCLIVRCSISDTFASVSPYKYDKLRSFSPETAIWMWSVLHFRLCF